MVDDAKMRLFQQRLFNEMPGLPVAFKRLRGWLVAEPRALVGTVQDGGVAWLDLHWLKARPQAQEATYEIVAEGDGTEDSYAAVLVKIRSTDDVEHAWVPVRRDELAELRGDPIWPAPGRRKRGRP